MRSVDPRYTRPVAFERAARYLLLGLSATSGGFGCWKYCTDAGCSSGLEITVLSSATTFAPGAYAVELEIDSDVVALSCQIPEALEPFPCNCQGGPSDAHVCLMHDALSVWVNGFPKSASVRLVRDGIEVGQKQFSPEYETVQPNGPGCKPTCRLAKEVAQF